MSEIIDSFSGQYRFLSNFYPSKVWMDGNEYPSVEHAFAAAKTLDPYMRSQIRAATSPGEAKRIGRALALRDGWDDMRLRVMEELVFLKFQDPLLGLKLLQTGRAKLVEGNTWKDRFWGVYHGVGENYLGKILMSCRTELRELRDLV